MVVDANMENLDKTALLTLLLKDALELLNDVHHKFGMFEHQRYSKIRSNSAKAKVLNALPPFNKKAQKCK